MPTTGSKTNDIQYDACLDEIREIMNKYNNCKFVLMGDMNASYSRNKPTTRDKTFISNMKEMNFKLPDNYPIGKTFHHYNGVSSYQIDYILPFNDKDLVTNVRILSRDYGNTSTHDPVIGQLLIKLNSLKDELESNIEKNNNLNSDGIINSKLIWNTVDVFKYKQLVDEKCELSNILNIEDPQKQILELADILNKSAIQSSE